MSKHRIFNGIFVACLMFSMTALAQDKKGGKEEPKMTPEQMAAMAAWTAAATPGPEHDWLKQWEGNWTTTTKSWWNGPDAAPTESKSSSKYSMALGGRYLTCSVKGEMMGMPFEGLGTMGYDNFKKEYAMTWLDNMGTGTYISTGQRSGNELTLQGTMSDPASGVKDKMYTYKWKLIDPTTATFEIWDNGKLQMQDSMTKAK